MTQNNSLEKGYVHVYTGNGKGKTTAALGLSLRASGAGLRTYIGQFMKGRHYSELDAVCEMMSHVTIEQFGHPDFCVPGKVSDNDRELAQTGMTKVREAISGGEYDIVVMDEICTALHFNLVDVSDIVELIKSKPEGIEMILTGRYAPQEIIDAADLVTEMREIKHYYQQKVTARKGIEN